MNATQRAKAPITTICNRPAPGDETIELQIARIRRDGDTMGRVSIDAGTVEEYASLMHEGVAFPPVKVWFDGRNHWLSDGFQRLAAAELAGLSHFSAEVTEGTLADAQWDSYGANSTHGLRRTSADLRAVLERLLRHSRGAEMSNYHISRHIGVPEATVRRWRRELSTSTGVDDKPKERVAVRAGTTYAIKTGNIGRPAAADPKRGFKSRADLQADLAEMKQKASPCSRRIINIFANWIVSGATAEECLLAVERLVNELTGPVTATTRAQKTA